MSEFNEAARTLWAKSPRKNPNGTEGAWVPVLNHMLDVAACAAEILKLEPPSTQEQMARDLGLEPEQGLAWLLALVALHDLGKATPAFQVLWPEGQRGVHPKLFFDPALTVPYTPHGVTSEVALADLLRRLKWPQTLRKQVSDAVGCHHGFRSEVSDYDLSSAQLGLQDNWINIRKELFRLSTLATGAKYETVPALESLPPQAFMRLAGLTSFADWLGSSFPLPTQTDFSAYDDPAGYFDRARQQARKTLEKIGWPQFTRLRAELPPLPEALPEVFDFLAKERGPAEVFRPRPLQTALAGALAGVQGPTLVLVEAPMGEGKTEAAFFSFLQLQNANAHRGLYLALPTQATGSAMLGRLVNFLDAQARASGVPGRQVSVQLAHGGTLLDKQFQKLRFQSNTDELQKDSSGRAINDAVKVEEWFTSRKRALLDEYGVGTVDQALLGVLGVSHQFVRLWGLGNRVVVLDEVHAYDTYTSELIAALVAWLRALGSSVVIMSATLPTESRRKLLKAWGADAGPEPAYPRWTVAEAGKPVRADTIPAVDSGGNASRPETRIKLQALPGDAQAVAQQAVQLVEHGGCVAVIVNTVQRAQTVQKLVLAALGANGIPTKTCTAGVPAGTEAVGVLLYHARYPADERKYREEAVLRFLGKDSKARPRRFILIATQVAEQSLDFDADVMLTDLAPIDLVLQRSGRLHRHQRPQGARHGHTNAVLYVAGLQDWPASSMKTEFWERVYEPALLYRSWWRLRQQLNGGITLPNDLDALVQDVYRAPLNAPELTTEQVTQVQQAELRLNAVRDSLETRGKFAHIGYPDPVAFWEARLNPRRDPEDTESVNDDTAAVFTADEDERPRTRLGEQGVRIVPVMRNADGVWVVCPPPKAMQPKGQPWQPLPTQTTTLARDDLDTAQRIYSRSLSVSRWEVVRAFNAGNLWKESLGSKHKGWLANPLLRDVVPFDLTGGSRDFGTVRVRLDTELGLVYESRS